VNGSVLAPFLVGFVAGGVVFWQVSKYLERFRRARYDFRRARHGISTLVEMMFRRGVEAAGWALIGLAVVAGLVLVAVKGLS
jgi:hypothetical protein